eukprot:11450755-Prorocentrum_lima.AAC.1
MTSSLVGSEMCIRDSFIHWSAAPKALRVGGGWNLPTSNHAWWPRDCTYTVSYTHLTLPTICSV